MINFWGYAKRNAFNLVGEKESKIEESVCLIGVS